MALDGSSYARLLAAGLLVTPMFLFLLAVIPGSECAGPCERPFLTPPILLGLLLAGPLAAAAGGLGLVAARRRRGLDDGVDRAAPDAMAPPAEPSDSVLFSLRRSIRGP